MSTGAPASPVLFTGLVDDAAVFPPGNAPMADAVAAHRDHAKAWYADLVGPFLCPASRLAELQEQLVANDTLRLRIVADGGADGLAGARDLLLDDDRVELVGLEVPLPPADDMGVAARTLLDVLDFSVDAYVEIPRVHGWEAALDVLAEDGVEHAKLRTGGATTDAYPSETEVAAFVRACLDRQVSFKLTAGLHHAVRRTDPVEGFEEHGFVNVLAATRAGLIGAETDAMAEILAERDRDVLVEHLTRMSDADAAVCRAFFLSYGSCSVTEPLDDLLALGLLQKEDL